MDKRRVDAGTVAVGAGATAEIVKERSGSVLETAAGKQVDLVVYPQSNHGWVRPQVWQHSTRAAFEFFERHLKTK